MSSSEESDDGGLGKGLSHKSKEQYLSAYESFMNWKRNNNEESLSENVFMNYFTKLCREQKPSSVWSIYSMLKSTCRVKHNVYLQNYTKITELLKRNSNGFKSTKSRIFAEDSIRKFLNEAPDERYLAHKVALIFGVCGGCRTVELVSLTTKDIKTQGNVNLVVISNSHYKTNRMFIIRDEFVAFVQKYLALRPKKMPTDRIFLNYKNGKCIKSVIGKNRLAAFPREIAAFLKLPNPERYTGHCFRRSATYSGLGWATVTKRKNKSDTEAEGLIANRVIGWETCKSNESTNPIVIDEELSQEVDIKIEEIEKPGEFEAALSFTESRSPMYFHDLQTQATTSLTDFRIVDLQPDSDVDIESVGMTDTVHIKSEEVDETINLRSRDSREKTQTSKKAQVSYDNQQTNISVAGNNITISFSNCTNVGNVTVHIHNK